MKLRTALLLCCLPLSACARDCAPVVKDGWIRLMPGGMPMQAGFGRIDNRCPMPATIVSASSPTYGSVELHESKVVAGVNRMREVPELRIAPDSAAVLQPGGLHLMLMQPTATLKPGSRVAVVFKLKDGREVIGEFEARKPAP
ncbi:MAG: copper chaperone PCu(A)C [Thermomonas sp.]|uniref:copper chaperone PCu(A)C n=1 Tax=Thermomonas sp. TaxID=1971895 RepID=UPI0039E29518